MSKTLVQRDVLVVNLCAVGKLVEAGEARQIGGLCGIDREYLVMQVSVPGGVKNEVTYFVISAPIIEPDEQAMEIVMHEPFECPAYSVDGTNPDAVAEGMMRVFRRAAWFATGEVVEAQKGLADALRSPQG